MEVLIGVAIGTILAFVITAMQDLRHRKQALKADNSLTENPRTIEEKIAPFIDIHLEQMAPIETNTEESINRLRNKIENFKQRNRFYTERPDNDSIKDVK